MDTGAQEQFVRTRMLLGQEGMERLYGSSVAVFGIGGVGGYTVEALARSGIGTLHLIDHDQVSVSNINRQIIATWKTVGRAKVEVMRERIRDISPSCVVTTSKCFYLPETADRFTWKEYDYIVDATDTVTAKIDLAVKAQEYGIPIISSMGAGNKLDPTAFEVADIYETSVCPLARVMRRELKKKGVKALKTVYSREEARNPQTDGEQGLEAGRRVPGSNAFVPAAAGLILAGEVIRDLAGVPRTE